MAAVGQGTGAAGGDDGQGEAQAQQQGGGDFSQIQGLLETQGQSLQEMQQLLQSQPWQAQQQGQQEETGDEFDLSFLDGPTIDPAAEEKARFEAYQRATDQRMQQAMAPVLEQQTAMRRDQAARDLAAEFPELATPEMAQKVAGRGGLAEQAAQALGQPQLAAEPSFWRLAYMAHKAAESANQEGSGDPGAASLESGGGAGPAQMTQEDRVKAIREAGGRGSSVLDRM